MAVAFRRRDPRILAPLTVLGGALGFDMVSFMGNGIQDFLRYWIVALPLGILLLGCLVAAVQIVSLSAGWSTRPNRDRHAMECDPLSVLAAVCLVLVVMIPTTLNTAFDMFNPNIGFEETEQLGIHLPCASERL